MNVGLRPLVGLLLLALVPVALFATGRASVAAVALVNVCIVAASLYYMFGPSEGDQGHAAA